MCPGLALNSLVHVILYIYYAYTAHYAAHRPSWKQAITQIQVIIIPSPHHQIQVIIIPSPHHSFEMGKNRMTMLLVHLKIYSV